MGIFAYDIFDSEGNHLGEHEEICKWNQALDEMEFVGDDGEVLIGRKKISVIAKTAGAWSGHGWFEPGLGTWVNNSKHRDAIAKERGLVVQDDVSSNKHLHRDMMEKKIAYNLYWDKRHQEFFDLKDAAIKRGFSEERAEMIASQEWATEDKLKKDQQNYKPSVANRTLPTNLGRKI